MATNVPNTSPTAVNVPNSAPTKSNVPNSKVEPPAKARTEVLVPDKISVLRRNRRLYTGQKLGVVHWDGSVHEITDVSLALVAGNSRVLDRAPWSALKIVEL